MKIWIKKNAIPLVLLIIGIIAAVMIVSQRVKIELASMSYDIVMDYDSLNSMSEESDMTIDEWLGFFRKQGIDKIAVNDTNLYKLAGTANSGVYAMPVQSIVSSFGWEKDFPSEIVKLINASKDDTDLLVAVKDEDMYSWILSAFDERAEDMKSIKLSVDGVSYIWIYENDDKIGGTRWGNLSLGIYPKTEEKVLSYGYTIVPRSAAVEKINGKKFADAVFKSIKTYNSPYFITGGMIIPGYDAKDTFADDTAEAIRDSGAAMCVVETSEQRQNLLFDGGDEVTEKLGYAVLRTFSMWDYVQKSYAKYGYEGPEEITNCIYRAAFERNCRLIYFKMLMKNGSGNEFITDTDDYEQFLGDFHARMQKNGFKYETVTPQTEYAPSIILRIVMGVGAVGGSVILLGLFVTLKDKYRYALIVLGSLCVAGVTYIAPNTSKLLLNIGGGILMPSVAAVGFNRIAKKICVSGEEYIGFGKVIVRAIFAAIGLFVISLTGSLFASAPLSESAFMIEAEIYRGVKVMQLIPLGIYAVSYVQVFWWEDVLRALKGRVKKYNGDNKVNIKKTWDSLMDTPVKVKAVVICFAVLCAAALALALGKYYLARTGNTSTVSTLEIRLRDFLEYTFVARPRTKEFLVGYPCIIMMMWCLSKKFRLLPAIFGAGAVIGVYVSIVNTFLHIRTRFLLSLVRELIGLGFGLVVGLLAVLAAEILYRLLIKKLGSKIRA